MVGSFPVWLGLLGVPFLPLTVASRGVMATGLVILAEVAFWGGRSSPGRRRSSEPGRGGVAWRRTSVVAAIRNPGSSPSEVAVEESARLVVHSIDVEHGFAIPSLGLGETIPPDGTRSPSAARVARRRAGWRLGRDRHRR